MEPLDGVYVHTTGDKRCSGSEGGRGMFVRGGYVLRSMREMMLVGMRACGVPVRLMAMGVM
jgi:hypothetical protein